MKIELDLKSHCIETETKRLYNRSVSQYFLPGADKQRLEKRIEMLKNALETLDFSRLRATYPQLCGGRGDHVAYRLESDGRTAIVINGKRVETFQEKP